MPDRSERIRELAEEGWDEHTGERPYPPEGVNKSKRGIRGGCWCEAAPSWSLRESTMWRIKTEIYGFRPCVS